LKVTASALSLVVADPEKSARFLEELFAFEREMGADGFVSLTRADVGFNVVYLRAGLPTFKPRERADRTVDGVLLVLVVDDIDAEYERLRDSGTPILTPIETEEWGERYFQVEDPNGVVVQIVQWVATPPETVVEVERPDSKNLMRAVCDALAVGNSRPFLDSLADDVRWTITGTTAWSRVYDGKREVQEELLAPLMAQFAARYTNRAERLIAEGDHVVIECRGDVMTKAGLPYRNTYCYVCRLDGGKVRELTEYWDTAHANAVLRPPTELTEQSA
jgi:ketosteroid isomerase-like protein/predicted enzyme related to lactoylglutathione lyase